MGEQLEKITPRARARLYDLVDAAGVDVSDWANFKGGAKKAASNPKYCYEWSFVQPGKVVVLNLWHTSMEEAGGVVSSTLNMRKLASEVSARLRDRLRRTEVRSAWERRAINMDTAIQAAVLKELPVRVVVCQGSMHDMEDPASETAHVHMRMLDPVAWAVQRYDWDTGEAHLVRGALPSPYVDQFDATNDSGPQAPEKKATKGEVFVRSRDVRMAALDRAKGVCELCSERGFITADGRTYLETHHIIPLSEEGPDVVSNVIALCPNDHRRAHYSADSRELRTKLQEIIAEKAGTA